jgi:hypothetical protein
MVNFARLLAPVVFFGWVRSIEGWPMATSPEIKYVNDARTVIGYGDTKDLAFNNLLEKLKIHESEIGCIGTCPNEGEVCRPFLVPPAGIKFRVYWRKSTGKIRWKCLWGPGALEFECACADKSED